MTLTTSPPEKIPSVIPAKAGTHLDLASDSAFAPAGLERTRESKIKMDPSVRWDDDVLGRLIAVSSTPSLAAGGHSPHRLALDQHKHTTEEGAD